MTDESKIGDPYGADTLQGAGAGKRYVLPAELHPDPLAVKIPSEAPPLMPAGSEMLMKEAGADTAPKTEEEEAVMGYDEQIAALKAAAAAIRQETPEEKAKRERREKSRRIIAATVDGASALANLFFTTRYAPDAYNPRSSQLGKVNERIEALKAGRRADADRYNSIMLRLGDTHNARAKTLRDLRAQQEAQKLAREKAERDAEEHGWLALLQPDIQREQKGKADRSESEARSAQAEAEMAPKMQQAKLQTEHARKGSYDASALASRASATNSYASAAAHNRSNVSEYRGLGRNGAYESFRTRQAAIDFERREGTYDPSHWGDDVQTVTERIVTENPEGKTTRTTSKKTRPKGKGYGDNTEKGAGY